MGSLIRKQRDILAEETDEVFEVLSGKEEGES